MGERTLYFWACAPLGRRGRIRRGVGTRTLRECDNGGRAGVEGHGSDGGGKVVLGGHVCGCTVTSGGETRVGATGSKPPDWPRRITRPPATPRAASCMSTVPAAYPPCTLCAEPAKLNCARCKTVAYCVVPCQKAHCARAQARVQRARRGGRGARRRAASAPTACRAPPRCPWRRWRRPRRAAAACSSCTCLSTRANAALLRRAVAAGMEAVVLTVDRPVLGLRDANARFGFTLPGRDPKKRARTSTPRWRTR